MRGTEVRESVYDDINDLSISVHLSGMPLANGSVQSIPIPPREETLIDDVIRPSTSIDDKGYAVIFHLTE